MSAPNDDEDGRMWRVQGHRHETPNLSTPWVLPEGAAGVTLARQATRRTLDDFGVDREDVLDVAELLVSELTSNVVKHTSGLATLSLTRHGDVLRIEVRDTDPNAAPVELAVDREADGGRGLLLVAALSSAWGFERDGAQKCTWAEIDLAVPASSASRA